MKILIIIPTYNEKENINDIVQEIKKYLSFYNYSILIIDDNSTDGTKEVLTKLTKDDTNIYLIERKAKLGLATAYVEGFKYGLKNGYDVMIQMDADFSHHPCFLQNMIEKMNLYDVVIGSRYVKSGSILGWGFIRKIISFGGSLFAKIVLNCPINDFTGGFNAWRKEVFEKINLDEIISKGYSFQVEIKYKAYKNNLKIKEIPIVFEDRKFGKSKMNKNIFFEAILNVIKLRIQK